MATQQQRRDATRGRLVEAAHAEFVRTGYDATTTEAVLERAGVSRGALYHHFPTKQELFAAVFEQVSREAVERAVARSRRHRSPLETLIGGCLAWLAVAREPAVAAILLDQGPQVLGWVRAREIEGRYSLALMKSGVEAAVDAGEIDVASVDLTAALLNALVAETALSTLHAGGTLGPRVVAKSVRQFVGGLAAG